MIKHTKYHINGTRNIAGQIAQRVAYENEIKKIAKNVKQSNPNLSHLIHTLIKEPIRSDVSFSSISTDNKINKTNTDLLNVLRIQDENIQFFNVFRNKHFTFHSKTFDANKARCNYYCLYKRKDKIKYGTIEIFFKWNNDDYCILSENHIELDSLDVFKISSEFKLTLKKYGFNEPFRLVRDINF